MHVLFSGSLSQPKEACFLFLERAQLAPAGPKEKLNKITKNRTGQKPAGVGIRPVMYCDTWRPQGRSLSMCPTSYHHVQHSRVRCHHLTNHHLLLTAWEKPIAAPVDVAPVEVSVGHGPARRGRVVKDHGVDISQDAAKRPCPRRRMRVPTTVMNSGLVD